MHGPGVEHHDCVFGDKLALVRKVLASHVGSAKPERIVAAFDLSTEEM